MTATIQSISAQSNDGTTVNFLVSVLFEDTATSFSVSKTYSFPINTTQAAAVAAITADGTTFKNALATVSNLQSKVGFVITI